MFFLDLNVLHSLNFFFFITDAAIFFSTTCRFQQNLAAYQNLITQSMYDKQLDSGRGTLLHLCDDVIQQEVSFKLRDFFSSYFTICSLFCSLQEFIFCSFQ